MELYKNNARNANSNNIYYINNLPGGTSNNDS